MLADNDQLEVVRVKTTTEVAGISKRCARDRKRYVDDMFPPEEAVWYAPDESHDEALSSGMKSPERWARLPEFVARPVLWPEEGPDPRSLLQGNVGTRYLLDAASLVAAVCPEALRALFLRHDAAVGVYTVAFWVNGQWRVVLLDDQVAVCTHTAIGSYCCFAECRKRRQIWLPLLEKAFAKMHRYYEHIHGGHMENALVDLTGGAMVSVDLANSLDNGIAWLHAYKGLVGEHGAMFHFAFHAGTLLGGGVIGEGVDRMEYSVIGSFDSKGYVKFTAAPANLNSKEGFTWQFIGMCNPDTKELHGDAWPTDNPDSPIKWNAQIMKISATEEQNPPYGMDSLWATMKTFADKGKQITTVYVDETNKTAASAGLVPGRRYLVMGQYDLPDGPTVIKLRDLSGTPEWNGDYAEQSPCWTPDNLSVWLENYDEGVFFVSQADFVRYFKAMEVLSVPWRNWQVSSMTGPWKDLRGPERWMYNPRFRFTLREPGQAFASFTIAQPDTKLYEGYDHYLVGIGFYVLLEITNNPPAKQLPQARSAAASALLGSVVVAHVPPRKAREVSVFMKLYRLEGGGAPGASQTMMGAAPATPGANGVYYIVPYCDVDGVDLPLFFTAHSDKRFHADFMKGFNSVLLPMPTRNEAYSDEYEKWYWEVRDKWDGVNAVISRGPTGRSTKVFEGVDHSLDAAKKPEETASMSSVLPKPDESIGETMAAPLAESTHVDTMFKRGSIGRLVKSSDAPTLSAQDDSHGRSLSQSGLLPTASQLQQEKVMGAPSPRSGGKLPSLKAVGAPAGASPAKPGEPVACAPIQLNPKRASVLGSPTTSGAPAPLPPIATGGVSSVVASPAPQESNGTGGWMTPGGTRRAAKPEGEASARPASPGRPRTPSAPPAKDPKSASPPSSRRASSASKRGDQHSSKVCIVM